MLGRSVWKVCSYNKLLFREISVKNIENKCSLFKKPLKLIGINNLINKRYNCTIKPPNKDEIAEEKMKELLSDPQMEKRFKIIQLEVDVLRQNGDMVPQEIKPRYWYELLLTKSVHKRKQQLQFLFKLEKKKEHQIEKKKNKIHQVPDDPNKPLHLQYRIGGNSFFLRLYEQTLNHLWNWRLARAAMFGQKLVIDCGYETDMTRRENKNCSKQLMYSFASNREADDPYDLYFCNFNLKGELHQNFHAFIPPLHNPEFPANITEKSYLDLFDRKKLVYLTPHCQNEMKNYDHDAIYIIGGIVDKVTNKPLSLAKAKREGIKMLKLPIEKYLHFGGGSGKSLTINQMINILNDLKMTNDWELALRHVPKRKLFENRQHQMKRKLERYIEKQEYCSSDSPQDYTNNFRSRKNNFY